MVGKCVKVRFINEEKVRNKVFRIQEMGYRELVTKIGESFQMIEGKKLCCNQFLSTTRSSHYTFQGLILKHKSKVTSNETPKGYMTFFALLELF